MEQAKGHGGANIVTVIMKSKGIDLQSAADFLAGYLECLIQQLLIVKLSLASRADPKFSADAVRFFEAVGDWIKGYDLYVLCPVYITIISDNIFGVLVGALQPNDTSESRIS
jgi:hypothetical protein